MQEVSDCLKTPTLYLATQLLGEMVPNEEDCVTTIYTYALALIFGICLIASLPLWFTGDILEFLSCQDFGDREVEVLDAAEFSLNPDRTTIMGFPISTYQYTSNPAFCANSDWGRYSQTHFTGDKAHLGPGHGVDILTPSGCHRICQAARMANANTIRFSIEWADVMNPDGSFNEVAMQKYVELARYIRTEDLVPIVVLHHFVTPLDQNGRSILETPDGIDAFVRYATYVHSKLKDDVQCFLTFNEPRVHSVMNHVMGEFPAGGIAQFWDSERLGRTMQEAHVRVHAALHAADSNVTVGMTHQVINMVPSSRWNYMARMISFVMTYAFHESFMRWAERNRNALDILGVQYYTRAYIGGVIPDSTCPEGGTMVEEMHFRFDPKGILPTLREMHNRLHVPLFVSETGTAAAKDVYRETEADERFRTYMDLSLRAVRTAQDEGLDVRGYMPWAPYDNFEWQHGNAKHFGLIASNLPTNEFRYTAGFHTVAKVFERTIAAAQPAHARSA